MAQALVGVEIHDDGSVDSSLCAGPGLAISRSSLAPDPDSYRLRPIMIAILMVASSSKSTPAWAIPPRTLEIAGHAGSDVSSIMEWSPLGFAGSHCHPPVI